MTFPKTFDDGIGHFWAGVKDSRAWIAFSLIIPHHWESEDFSREGFL